MANYKAHTDVELTAFLAEGDNAAFAEIYNRYWVVLYSHARKMTRDDDLAKDVVQDVFISLWDKVAETEFSFSLKAYLYATVRNRILNLYDKEKVKSKYLSSLEDFDRSGENVTDYRLRETLLAEHIDREILQLPGKMREIFEMSRKLNMTYKEISEQLDISDKTVKKQMSNAIKILRVKLGSLFSVFFTL